MRPGSASALAALALLATATPRAAAGEGMELVLSLGAGVYVPTWDNRFVVYDPAIFGAPGLAVDTLQPGVDLELAVSAWWGLFGAQIGVGYLGASWDQTGVDVVPVTALLRVRLPLGSFAPYLEGGAGVCFTSSTTLGGGLIGGISPPTAVTFTATTLEWIAGAGVDLDLGSVRVGASVRYLWFDPSPISAQGGPLQLRYDSMRFTLDGLTAAGSVGYRFLP